jgi:4-amino-4-deoxy-L-arabinose transferase-like glycosyltransferase
VNFRVRLEKDSSKWRCALLVFIVIYAFLLFGIGPVQLLWDEMPHLYGGLLLAKGDLSEYIAIYSYYPPLYDIITTGFFHIFGINITAGRLTAGIFALFSIWLVFEFANLTYGPKTGLISSILFGSMPSFFWISRFALLETVMIFFFLLTLFFFFKWIRVDKNKTLILSGLTLGIGFLAKYQILVAGLIMIASVMLYYRNKLRAKLTKLVILGIIALAIVIPWFLVTRFVKLGELGNVIQGGSEERISYSVRFPLPIFYLIEMTWPYPHTHPIWLTVYILGLLGIGLWLHRQKTEEKLFLTWFVIVYVFFALIPNKQWRYIVPVFPVLAISAASIIVYIFNKLTKTCKAMPTNSNKKLMVKAVAAFFVFFSVSSVVYSFYEGYQWVARNQIYIPIDEATNFVAVHVDQTDSILVLCATGAYNQDMVKFYLNKNALRQNQILQYPVLPVDAFKPRFDVNELIDLCEENRVKYVMLYEYGATVHYYESTLTLHDVYIMLLNSDRFTYVTIFGDSPRTITILSFT